MAFFGADKRCGFRGRAEGVLGLTRYREYPFFVVVTTLLGAASVGATFGWLLARVLIANWLAVGFAFMINDVEDAPDDALDPTKARRNPVSAGKLSGRLGRFVAFLVAGAGLALYATLGPLPLVTGLVCVVTGFLYSWRPVRLKALPVIDLLSHAMMLAGFQFLAAYFTFGPRRDHAWLFPLIFVLAISMYGELFNELRDFEGDSRAGVRHTASHLGPVTTHALMGLLLAIGAAAAGVSIVVVKLIPIWVLACLGVLACILLARPVFRWRLSQSAVSLHEPFQKPLEMATAFALAMHFLRPWAEGVMRAAPRLPWPIPWP